MIGGGGTVIIPIRRDGGEEAEGTSNTTTPCTHKHARILCNATCVNTVPRLVATGNLCLSSERRYVFFSSIFTSAKVLVFLKALTCLSVCEHPLKDERTLGHLPPPFTNTHTHTLLFWLEVTREEMSR